MECGGLPPLSRKLNVPQQNKLGEACLARFQRAERIHAARCSSFKAPELQLSRRNPAVAQ
jgi:hypothetical protein